MRLGNSQARTRVDTQLFRRSAHGDQPAGKTSVTGNYRPAPRRTPLPIHGRTTNYGTENYTHSLPACAHHAKALPPNGMRNPMAQELSNRDSFIRYLTGEYSKRRHKLTATSTDGYDEDHRWAHLQRRKKHPTERKHSRPLLSRGTPNWHRR